MPIVTAKDRFQVVIPQSVRRQLGINRGDVLEAKVERGKLTYSPKILMERSREIAPAPPALKAIQKEAKRKGTNKLTMREINTEVAAVRRQTGKRKCHFECSKWFWMQKNVIVSANLNPSEWKPWWFAWQPIGRFSLRLTLYTGRIRRYLPILFRIRIRMQKRYGLLIAISCEALRGQESTSPEKTANHTGGPRPQPNPSSRSEALSERRP